MAKIAHPGHDGGASAGNRDLPSKTIEEPARQSPLYGEYDVAVLGGGPAGMAAAVAAARAGRRTLLIERYGFLGGMSVDDAAYARLVKLHSAKRQTAEASEGLASFAEKRAANWDAGKG